MFRLLPQGNDQQELHAHLVHNQRVAHSSDGQYTLAPDTGHSFLCVVVPRVVGVEHVLAPFVPSYTFPDVFIDLNESDKEDD